MSEVEESLQALNNLREAFVAPETKNTNAKTQLKTHIAPTISFELYQKALEERDFWKKGWEDQRDATGKNYWDGYYRGILIGLRCSPNWTSRMYQIASRIATLLGNRRIGTALFKQVDPEHSAKIHREVSELLSKGDD